MEQLISLMESTLQTKITGRQGQLVGFDKNGKPIATDVSFEGNEGGYASYGFEIDSDGYLCLVYEDGTTPPNFYIDEDDGYLYLELELEGD